jgi:hypothetical protein
LTAPLGLPRSSPAAWRLGHFTQRRHFCGYVLARVQPAAPCSPRARARRARPGGCSAAHTNAARTSAADVTQRSGSTLGKGCKTITKKEFRHRHRNRRSDQRGRSLDQPTDLSQSVDFNIATDVLRLAHLLPASGACLGIHARPARNRCPLMRLRRARA